MNLEQYDGLGLASLIAQKKISPQELLNYTEAKLCRLQPKYNFLSHTFFEDAKNQITNGLSQGPFAGVPFCLKNLGGCCKNTPLTEGSQLFSKFICSHDDEIIQRFKKAGLVFYGRSNTPEMGLSFTTEPLAYGATRNPWNMDYSTGGSSGGAAALVAARISPLAHASDGGGSIRVPAACCGLFGLKPTRARVPMGPMLGESWGGFAAHHILSLSVRDSAAMLDCISGPAIGDPYFAPHKNLNYLSVLDKPLQRLKIGVVDQLKSGENLDNCVTQAFTRSQKLLLELGHELENCDLNIDIDSMRRAFVIIASSNFKNIVDGVNSGSNEQLQLLEPINQQFYEFASSLSASEYANAVNTIHRYARKTLVTFANYDVILMPTTAEVTKKIGFLAGSETDLASFNARQLYFSPFTALANMTGQPAMSVPLFWNKDNLPVGTQFLAQPGCEDLLFQLAHELELSRPWFNKKPEIID